MSTPSRFVQILGLIALCLGAAWIFVSSSDNNQLEEKVDNLNGYEGELRSGVRLSPAVVREANEISREGMPVEQSSEIQPSPNQMRKVSLVKEGGDSPSVVTGAFLSLDSKDEPIPFDLSETEDGIYLSIPPDYLEMEIQDGWTAVPDGIAPTEQNAIIRLFPPRSVSIRFRQDNQWVSKATVSIVGAEKSYAWTGETDASGLIRLTQMPTRAVYILLQSERFFAAWSFPAGIGAGEKSLELKVPDLVPAKLFTFLDAETGKPIAGASFSWDENIRLGRVASKDGKSALASRSSNIDVVQAIAPGYLPKLVSLSEDDAEIRLERTESFKFMVEGENGNGVAGALVRIYSHKGSIESNSVSLLDEVQCDGSGFFLANIPQSSEISMLARHPTLGTAVVRFRANESTEELLTIKLSPRAPLRVNVSNLQQSGTPTVITRSVFGEKVEWELINPTTVVFPDASLLNYFEIKSAGVGGLEIKRLRSLSSASALLDDATLTSLSGELDLALASRIEVHGRIQDDSGTTLPWQPLQLRAVRHYEASANLNSFPDLGGNLPTGLLGWQHYRGPLVYAATSDSEGKFSVEGLLPGDYLFELPDPSRKNFGVPFGVNPTDFVMILPAYGEIVLTYPRKSFIDIDISDSSSGKPIDGGSLEIAYGSFLHSGRVIGRKFRGGRISQWVFWTIGVKARVVADGYASTEITNLLWDRQSGSVEVTMERLLPMILSWTEEGGRSVEMAFYRPYSLDEEMERLKSVIVPVSDEGILEVYAPFEDCMVSVKSLRDSPAPDQPKPKYFSYAPGRKLDISD